MNKHIITPEETSHGWKAVCSCGGFELGFFPNAARAKRAAMNTSHGEFNKQPQADFQNVEDEK